MPIILLAIVTATFLAAFSPLAHAGSYYCVSADGSGFPYLTEENEPTINVNWWDGTPHTCTLRKVNRGPTVRGKLLSHHRERCAAEKRLFSVELDQGGRCDCRFGELLCP